MSAYITGIHSFLPHKPVPNDRIEQVLGMVSDRPSSVKDLILGRNGIKWRYYAVDPQTQQLTHTNAELTAACVRLRRRAAIVTLPVSTTAASGRQRPPRPPASPRKQLGAPRSTTAAPRSSLTGVDQTILVRSTKERCRRDDFRQLVRRCPGLDSAMRVQPSALAAEHLQGPART